MGITLRFPSVSLGPQHPLAVKAAGAEKTTGLGGPNSPWFLHSEAPVLVLTKAHMLWVCLQVITEKNLFRLPRQDGLSPAQLGTGFLVGASSMLQNGWGQRQAPSLRAPAHAWHVSVWR